MKCKIINLNRTTPKIIKSFEFQMPSLTTARSCCSALVYNDKLYVAGGYSGVYVQSVEVWDFTGSWKKIKPLNHPRADAVLIEFGGKMFGKKGIHILKNKTLD